MSSQNNTSATTTRVVVGIETSCDETSVAVLLDGTLASNVVASQIKLHEEYGGVVPELATREHLRNLSTVFSKALKEARVQSSDIGTVAATQGPGLPNALQIGFQAAQGLSLGLGIPLFGIHHHEAHLYSPWIDQNCGQSEYEAFEPHLSLIVSGGHTMLVHVTGEFEHKVIGATMDDAAGECFDKTAKLLGLPYPGGPHLERVAQGGNPKAHAFPRPMLKDANDDFSFSGLKTAVRYHLRDHPETMLDAGLIKDVCSGIQSAIVEVLVTKAIRAAKRLGVGCITASGGVTCNNHFRESLQLACKLAGMRCRVASKLLCTDNAAMVAMVADRKISLGFAPTPIIEECKPQWQL